jgi:MOSC domain-containing protein YiiM
MARLLSVNVGLPRDIEWKGRTVHTGIWKDPLPGRCRVGRLNLDGDGAAQRDASYCRAEDSLPSQSPRSEPFA